MCFSAYAQYSPRPTRTTSEVDPPAAIATALAADPNIFGRLAEDAHPASHHHHHDVPGASPAGPAGSGTVESVIVTLPGGRRLLITPLD